MFVDENMNKGQSKTGTNIKNYIENADEYIRNFSPARNSEFSEHSEMDMTRLHESRHAEI